MGTFTNFCRKGILALLIVVGTMLSSTAHCISNAKITNPTISGGVMKFTLSFKYDRYAGDDFLNINIWQASKYPSYDYSQGPTTTRLGGANSRPIGTIIINIDDVINTTTYNSNQAYVAVYQNDGTFTIITTPASNLVYNSSTNTYTLNNLSMTVPSGTTTLKLDTWCSTANNNSSIHYACTNYTLPVPAAMPVEGLESFKGVPIKGSGASFSWTTQMEHNNSYFELQRLVIMGKDTSYVSAGVVFSKYEDGNSSMPTSYSITVDRPLKERILASSLGLFLVVFILSGLVRKYVPARLLCGLTALILICNTAWACNKSSIKNPMYSDSDWYRLKQVDKDGNSAVSDLRKIVYN